VINGAPHREAAQRLFEFLQRDNVVRELITAKALEAFSVSLVATPVLKINWTVLLRDLEPTTAQLSAIFLR
jgi:hypothetical protein